LASVTIHDLRAYADFLYGEDLSIVTVHGHLRSLRRLYNWMMEEGLVTDNLAQRIQLPPPEPVARVRVAAGVHGSGPAFAPGRLLL
jgi:site-specific recombinase XerD